MSYPLRSLSLGEWALCLACFFFCVPVFGLALIVLIRFFLG